MDKLPGSNTAVYSGSMTNDYELLSTRDLYDMPHNSATGNGRTMLANRLSWFFDLQGPSIMMDTACSSSLTAVHLASQALRAGECEMVSRTQREDIMLKETDKIATGHGHGGQSHLAPYLDTETLLHAHDEPRWYQSFI